MRLAAIALALVACSTSHAPRKREEHHWPQCNSGELHIDTTDRHRCASFLRMKCGPDGGINGPMLCTSLRSEMACAADCPCGLTDFGTDATGWRRCGHINHDQPLFRD